MNLHSAIAIIPARLGSTRFPGKVLADATGRPMIVHVCEQAVKAARVSRVAVAADAPEIRAAVEAAGFECVMTSADHPNGTSRLAEAAASLKVHRRDLVVNVQGDEPEIEPGVIDAAVDAASHAASPPWPVDRRYADIAVGTVASPLSNATQAEDPNIVKVVCGRETEGARRAIYFSRSRIPFDRDDAGVTPLRHVGIYAYSCSALKHYTGLPHTPLEQAERLEQLRWLEHGFPIAVAIRDSHHAGIDTPEQYEAFVDRWRARNA